MSYNEDPERENLLAKEEKILSKREKLSNLFSSKACKEYGLLMVLLFSQFSALCTDTFLFPFFPQEAKSKGLNHFEIGTVYGSFELARFTTAPVLGYLLSWISPRITCITATITLAITCIALGLMTYAPNHLFLPLCITIRAIAGSATASLTVSAMTILLKHTSFQTSTVVSLLEMLQGGGYAVGPALGAALHQIGGYTCMFWTLGGVIGATFLAQLFVVPEIRNERKSQSLSSLHMLKLPGIIVLVLHCFAYKFVGSSRTIGISSYLYSTFGTTPTQSGLYFGFWSTLYLVGCPLFTKIILNGYIYSLMIPAWCISIFLNLFCGPSPLLDFIFHGKKYLALPVVLISVSNTMQPAIYIPPFQAAIDLAIVNGHEKDSIQTYGMVTGLLNGGLAFGAMVGPVVSGAITDTTDFTWALTVLSGMGLTMLIIMSTYLIWMKISGQPLRPE